MSMCKGTTKLFQCVKEQPHDVNV